MCGAMAGVWCPTFMCVHTVKEATGAAGLDGTELEQPFEWAGKFSMGS